jgi:hypothetical protein
MGHTPPKDLEAHATVSMRLDLVSYTKCCKPTHEFAVSNVRRREDGRGGLPRGLPCGLFAEEQRCLNVATCVALAVVRS